MQATLYVEKAELFAKSKFVVGYDTAVRLVMPKYYGGHGKMLMELAALHHRGCRFLVAGRVGEDGTFLQLGDIDIPQEISDKVTDRAVPTDQVISWSSLSVHLGPKCPQKSPAAVFSYTRAMRLAATRCCEIASMNS